MANQPSERPLRFTLKGVAALAVAVSVCCAVVPEAGLVVAGAMPAVAGFLVFVVGDAHDRDWVRILGVTLMALGLGVGAVLMVMLQGAGR